MKGSIRKRSFLVEYIFFRATNFALSILYRSNVNQFGTNGKIGQEKKWTALFTISIIDLVKRKIAFTKRKFSVLWAVCALFGT